MIAELIKDKFQELGYTVNKAAGVSAHDFTVYPNFFAVGKDGHLVAQFQIGNSGLVMATAFNCLNGTKFVSLNDPDFMERLIETAEAGYTRSLNMGKPNDRSIL